MTLKSLCYIFVFSVLLLLVNGPMASAVTYSQSSGDLDKASIYTNCTSLTAVKKPDFVSFSGSGTQYELRASKLAFHYWITLDCDGQQIRFKYTTNYGGNKVTRLARALLERMDTRHINVFPPVGTPGGILFRDDGGEAVRISPASSPGICVAIGGSFVSPFPGIYDEQFSILKGIILDADCEKSIPWYKRLPSD